MPPPQHPGHPLRRHLLSGAVALAGLQALRATAAVPTTIRVWKDPSCGCCNDWMAHLEQDGFRVQAHDEGNNGARHRLGLPRRYASCHTAQVGGYVVEGHVPVADIRRLLRKQPAAPGLAVPGMPVDSPGMDGPIHEGRRDPCDVLLVQADGSATVFNRYG